MKIRLPNPDDYADNVGMFFEQLELCVHHARKSWEKLIKDYSDEQLVKEGERPYLTYKVNVLEVDYDKHYEILDNRLEQDIDIEINTP